MTFVPVLSNGAELRVPRPVIVTEIDPVRFAVQRYGRAGFHRGSDELPAFEHQLYRLDWPGETRLLTKGTGPARPSGFGFDPDPLVPTEILWEMTDLWSDRSNRPRAPIPLSRLFNQIKDRYLVEKILGSKHCTDALRYHFAVNRWWSASALGNPPRCPADVEEVDGEIGSVLYESPTRVGPLVTSMVDEVLDARFALSPEIWLRLEHIFALMVTLTKHPVLGVAHDVVRSGVPYTIRPTLVSLARSYFVLLEDHLYDHRTRWWSRDRGMWKEQAMLMLLSDQADGRERRTLVEAGVLNEDGTLRKDMLVPEEGTDLDDLYLACTAWTEELLGVELEELSGLSETDQFELREGRWKKNMAPSPAERLEARLADVVAKEERQPSPAEIDAGVSKMRMQAILNAIEPLYRSMARIHHLSLWGYRESLEEWRKEVFANGSIQTVRFVDVQLQRVHRLEKEAKKDGNDFVAKIEVEARNNPRLIVATRDFCDQVLDAIDARYVDARVAASVLHLLDKAKDTFLIDAYPPVQTPLSERHENERELIVMLTNLEGKIRKIVNEAPAEPPPDVLKGLSPGIMPNMLPRMIQEEDDSGGDRPAEPKEGVVEHEAEPEHQEEDMDVQDIHSQIQAILREDDEEDSARPVEERVRAPMSMPYDTGDSRSAAAGDDHKKNALMAQLLKSAAEMGATVDEVKECFPEVADLIDRAMERKRQQDQ